MTADSIEHHSDTAAGSYAAGQARSSYAGQPWEMEDEGYDLGGQQSNRQVSIVMFTRHL